MDYELVNFDETRQKYFVPRILRPNGPLVQEWISDLKSVSDIFPQGTLVDVHEKGNYEDLISKLNERLCGNAQLEIMEVSKQLLGTYLEHTKESNPQVYAELKKYDGGPRCSHSRCVEPCAFGKRDGLTRLI